MFAGAFSLSSISSLAYSVVEPNDLGDDVSFTWADFDVTGFIFKGATTVIENGNFWFREASLYKDLKPIDKFDVMPVMTTTEESAWPSRIIYNRDFLSDSGGDVEQQLSP